MQARLLNHAKHMRREPTEAEALLWRRLRAHRFANYKFKRQQPLGPYIVDFVCFTSKLVIEVDGSQHGEAQAYDTARTAWLESQGFRVIRFGTTTSCSRRNVCWMKCGGYCKRADAPLSLALRAGPVAP